MAKIFSGADGTITGYAQSWDIQQRWFKNAPADVVTSLEFDEDTNSALAIDLTINVNLYKLTAGPILKKNGVTIAITAASSMYAIRSQLEAGFTDATFKSTIAALWNGTATNAQVQKAIAYIAYKLRTGGII
jgi:hypothetical protein